MGKQATGRVHRGLRPAVLQVLLNEGKAMGARGVYAELPDEIAPRELRAVRQALYSLRQAGWIAPVNGQAGLCQITPRGVQHLRERGHIVAGTVECWVGREPVGHMPCGLYAERPTLGKDEIVPDRHDPLAGASLPSEIGAQLGLAPGEIRRIKIQIQEEL